ncbi:hypothetical protein KFU94_32820 [Chloroflexi bacterium TSY]|nr:hypothetical protein [Chloroflexi bacterium TSY]
MNTLNGTTTLPGIIVGISVGIDPNKCAETDTIVVSSGTTVYQCLTISNLSNITYSTHSIYEGFTNRSLGQLTYDLRPQETVNTVDLGLVISQTVTESISASTTWSSSAISKAALGGMNQTDLTPKNRSIVTSTSRYTVTIPTIQATLTAALEDECAATTLDVPVNTGTTVYFCYRAVNTGEVPFDTHTAFDNIQGILTENQHFLLLPSKIGQFIIARSITQTVDITFTWIAQVPQDWPNLAPNVVTATSTASTQVEVIPPATFRALVFNDIDQSGSQSDNEVEFMMSSSRFSHQTRGLSPRRPMRRASNFGNLIPDRYTVTINLGKYDLTTENQSKQIVLGSGDLVDENMGYISTPNRSLSL